MSNIDNMYNSPTVSNNVIGIALEDFTYGEEAKIAIPSLIPFYNTTEVDEQEERIKKANIMNSNPLTYNPKSSSCNYISILIPEELYRFNINQKDIDYKGSKGDKFLISFAGGDISYPVVIRRL